MTALSPRCGQAGAAGLAAADRRRRRDRPVNQRPTAAVSVGSPLLQLYADGGVLTHQLHDVEVLRPARPQVSALAYSCRPYGDSGCSCKLTRSSPTATPSSTNCGWPGRPSRSRQHRPFAALPPSFTAFHRGSAGPMAYSCHPCGESDCSCKLTRSSAQTGRAQAAAGRAAGRAAGLRGGPAHLQRAAHHQVAAGHLAVCHLIVCILDSMPLCSRHCRA